MGGARGEGWGGGWLRRGVGSVAAGAPPAGAPPLRPSAVGIRRALLESTRQGGVWLQVGRGRGPRWAAHGVRGGGGPAEAGRGKCRSRCPPSGGAPPRAQRCRHT